MVHQDLIIYLSIQMMEKKPMLNTWDKNNVCRISLIPKLQLGNVYINQDKK
jgi:hypothetical protein